jgi:hypothetical protein
MKKIIVSLMAAASLCSAPAAFAQTWSPSGPGVVGTDTIEVRKLLTLICDIDGGTSINVSGSTHQINSLGLSQGSSGSSNCPNIGFTGFPYVVEPAGGTSLTQVVIRNVVVQGITGNCAGDLLADFDQTTGELTFSHANTIPATSGIGPCSLEGIVTTTPAVSYTIP